MGPKKPGWRLFLYCVKLAHIVDASAKALNRTELPSFTSWKTMLIYPCTKCMYCCWDPTTQSNGLGPIWYLQPKLGFRRNSFMMLGTCLAGSTHQIHSQQSWGQSTSMQTSATTCFTCTNRLITCQYLSQIHIPILDFNEKILFQAPVKNCGNSPQSALEDRKNHS